MHHDTKSRANEVDELLKDLKSATDTKQSSKLFNRVTLILVHDRWFNAEQQASVVAGAKASMGLTKRQKKLHLPQTRDLDDDDYNDEGWNYEGHDDYGSYD